MPALGELPFILYMLFHVDMLVFFIPKYAIFPHLSSSKQIPSMYSDIISTILFIQELASS